jgi:hypothetical protein
MLLNFMPYLKNMEMPPLLDNTGIIFIFLYLLTFVESDFLYYFEYDDVLNSNFY